MKFKEIFKKYGDMESNLIDAFEVFDDLETLLRTSPSIDVFKSIIDVLKVDFKKKIINYNETILAEYDEECLKCMGVDGPKSTHTNNKISENNIQLIKLYQQSRDIEIRNQIIMKNIKLISKYAYKYSRRSLIEFDDLVQEGVLGIMDAIERFDLSKNTEFSTYAVYWIKQRIRRAIQNKGNTIRLPIHIYEQLDKINRFENKYITSGLEIDKENICSILNISIEKYNKLKDLEAAFLKSTSLNSLIGEDDETELLEFIPSYDEKSLEDVVMEKELRKEIEWALSTLRPREKDIIIQRFGIKDGIHKTLEQVGKKHSVTRERIRQIESRAIKRLRNPNRSNRLKVYMS